MQPIFFFWWNLAFLEPLYGVLVEHTNLNVLFNEYCSLSLLLLAAGKQTVAIQCEDFMEMSSTQASDGKSFYFW